MLKVEEELTELCYKNISIKESQIQKDEVIFKDGFQLVFPNFQNDLFPKHIPHLME